MARHKRKSFLRLQARTKGFDAPDLRGTGYGSIDSFQKGRKRPGSLNAHKGSF